jgi:hypothetical protein
MNVLNLYTYVYTGVKGAKRSRSNNNDDGGDELDRVDVIDSPEVRT